MLASINAIGCEFGDTAFLNPGELRGVTAPKKGIGVIFPPCPAQADSTPQLTHENAAASAWIKSDLPVCDGYRVRRPPLQGIPLPIARMGVRHSAEQESC